MSSLGQFFFYGFLLTAFLGLFASWVDRKVTARVQYRVGPPFWQPLTDIVKLLGKETIIPAGAARLTFLSAPLFGLASVILVSTLLWVNALKVGESFVGDLIVVLYLLTIPAISLIMGGFASRNPLASLGASREMKLVLSYELPFLLCVFVPVIHAHFSVRLGDILSYQAAHGAIAASWSGMLGLIVGILCVQAKLGLVPFDVAEAETEIVGGPLIEYSGSGLAVYRLTRNMLLFTLPFFLIALFLGGIRPGVAGGALTLLTYLGLVAAATVIRNTNPRLRIDQALRFFWGRLTPLAALAVLLALKGY